MQSAKKRKLMPKNQVSSSLARIEFATAVNSKIFKQQVLKWLETDFNKRPDVNNHFWHNKNTIARAFVEHCALVALNHQEECIAYMTWSFYGNKIGAEIEIVEVKEEYRKQGILKKMLESFCQKFPEIAILSGNVLPSSEAVFQRVGWNKRGGKDIKILKPCLESSNTLTKGLVIVVCENDFNAVKNKPEQFHKKYFKISLTEEKKLAAPIVTEHHSEGYVGVYLNQQLVAEGKAKYLFAKEGFIHVGNLLILNRIIPLQPKVFEEFFMGSQREMIEEASHSQRLFSVEIPRVETEGLKEIPTNPVLFSSSFSMAPKIKENFKASTNVFNAARRLTGKISDD